MVNVQMRYHYWLKSEIENHLPVVQILSFHFGKNRIFLVFSVFKGFVFVIGNMALSRIFSERC